MDRSNFNPDQLHEHFDRIKGTFGIELEDNGRMVKLPTGHRFGVGRSLFNIQTTPGLSNEVNIRLLTEAGEIGEMGVTGDRAGMILRNTGNMGEDLKIPSNVPKSKHIKIVPLNEQHTQQDMTRVGHHPKTGDLWSNIWNPSEEFLDRTVRESMPFAKRTPETLDNPATFDIRRYPDFSDPRRDDAPDWIISNPVISLGKMSMNRQSGRFEWIPD
jgi:hypothetical protein